MVQELIPVVHHNKEELESSVFHVQQLFAFNSLNMIETKIAQCLQIQTHYEDNVVKFHGQKYQMLQIDPEAQAEILPSSIAESRSFATFKRAASVL